MEALSPRSPNLPLKSKVQTTQNKLDRHAPQIPAAARPAPNKAGHSKAAAPSKIHPPPPPPIVYEPGEDGERYATGQYLGKGGFAICYEGRLLRNGRVFAMKVVRSEMTQKKMAEKFRTELEIHSKLRHPNIVRFHRAFSFEQCTYVILDLCPNGSVMDMVKRRKCLSVPEVRRIMVQLCGAVKYLHKRNIAHRDLKMGNLFLDRNMDIKVGDFGLAAMILSEKEEKRRQTLCGTPNYIAPEVIDRSKGGHNQKVDIWSLGVICFAMLAGYPPFQSKTQEEIYRKVRNLSYVWPNGEECLNHIPEEAKSLVSSCLSLNEDERPLPDDIVEHDFFNMYPGCIPRRLDPSCLQVRPIWLKDGDPRGDRMLPGYSLDYEDRYRRKASHIKDPVERYAFCRNEFYTECGVGRKPDGSARKCAGKNSSKSVLSETISETEKGLSPKIPLPPDTVYRYPVWFDGDWSAPEDEKWTGEQQNDSGSDDSLENISTSTSLKNDRELLARTQAALAAVEARRQVSQPQSHAATLRQQALPIRQTSRGMTTMREAQPQLSSERHQLMSPEPPLESPPRGLAQRPMRIARGVAPGYSASIRELDRIVAHPMPKSDSVPNMVQTRSQSRRQQEADPTGYQYHPRSAPNGAQHRPPSAEEREELRTGPARPRPARAPSRQEDNHQPMERERYPQQASSGDVRQISRGSSKSSSTSSSSETKSRSALGAGPVIHSSEKYELLMGSSPEEVLMDIRRMAKSLASPSPARRSYRTQTKRRPHTYVIKWVDYTNRYGIGYVLDDGSVGCVFKGENGHPASCVVFRDGEKHIRRKARSQGSTGTYSEADQLVPRNGKPVEFYENCDRGPPGSRGIRKLLVQPEVFEVKVSKSGSGAMGVRVRTDAGVDFARSEAEKIKRLKLVDQFGKYMIGSLGRHDDGDDDDSNDENAGSDSSTQYIKFYQRLGNVGVWGFGDGAFQFNFPDHTKLVISHGSARGSSPWIDFYHLSPSAARYLRAHGKMHPNGYDTRAIASDEAATFLAIARGTTQSSADERVQEILDANSFLSKIDFVRDVLNNWIQGGRLGGWPETSDKDGSQGGPFGMYWNGTQERSSSGGKYVWVTVGAPGGDGEYVCRTLGDKGPTT